MRNFKYKNGTLINKLGIRDPKKLAKLEYQLSAQIGNQMLKYPIKIKNLKQLKLIHKYLFSSLYSWAGKFGNYQLQKEKSRGSNQINSWFLRSNSFNNACAYINKLIREINNSKSPKVIQYAQLLDCINYLHPFREGNGRSTKIFIQIIAINHHQFIQYNRDSKIMSQPPLTKVRGMQVTDPNGSDQLQLIWIRLLPQITRSPDRITKPFYFRGLPYGRM